MRHSFYLFFLSAIVLSGMIASPSFATDDLCPQDTAAVKNVPGDVAGVQADIDRLNLCVERAKLLKQLDDIAKTRSDTLNKIKDPLGSSLGGMGGNMGGTLSGGVSGIAPLPLNALPELPTVKSTELRPGDVKINKASGTPFGGNNDKAGEDKDVPKKQGWKIRKIFGQAGGVTGAVMHAQLSDGNGTLINVVKGDPLPDGKTVQDVSVKGVSLSGGKGSSDKNNVTDLSWDDVAGSSDATEKSLEGLK